MKEWGPVNVVANPPQTSLATRKVVIQLLHRVSTDTWRRSVTLEVHLCPNCQRHISKNGYLMFQKTPRRSIICPCPRLWNRWKSWPCWCKIFHSERLQNNLLNSETNSLNILYVQVYTSVRAWINTATYICPHTECTQFSLHITVYRKEMNAKYNGDDRGLYSGSLVLQSGWRTHPYSRLRFVNVTIHPTQL